jgi:hypothetical protein
MTTNITQSDSQELLFQAERWTLTYKKNSATFDMTEFPNTSGLERVFFDSKMMRIIYTICDNEHDAEYYEVRDKRYWVMPTGDNRYALGDLRDFVLDNPEVPKEVKDAVWSRRPFRTFKEVADGYVQQLWYEYEDRTYRDMLLSFFAEHGVSVTVPK